LSVIGKESLKPVFDMGKTSRRKQTVKAFEKGTTAVVIPWTDDALFNGGEMDSPSVAGFLKRISECESLVDQVRIVQSEKAALKSIFSAAASGSTVPLTRVKNCLSDLLVLYLLPHSLALRNSLEWIADIAQKSTVLSPEFFADCAAESCCRVMNLVRKESVSNMQIDWLLSWTFTLECISILDKERSWLSRPVDGSVSSFEFLSITLNIFRVCVQNISSPQDLGKTKSSAEVLRYAESSGQCMRVISNILKNRKINLRDQNEDWEEFCRTAYTCSKEVLTSSLVSKVTLFSLL
jgi:hypothetical protein